MIFLRKLDIIYARTFNYCDNETHCKGLETLDKTSVYRAEVAVHFTIITEEMGYDM
jgi:hypothetical protein